VKFFYWDNEKQKEYCINDLPDLYEHLVKVVEFYLLAMYTEDIQQ